MYIYIYNHWYRPTNSGHSQGFSSQLFSQGEHGCRAEPTNDAARALRSHQCVDLPSSRAAQKHSKLGRRGELFRNQCGVKQCHFYHPLGMVTIPPIYGDLGDGLFLFYSFTNIISIKVTLLFGWINHYSPLWFTI